MAARAGLESPEVVVLPNWSVLMSLGTAIAIMMMPMTTGTRPMSVMAMSTR